MKKAFLIFCVLFFAASILKAQLLIENPSYGTVTRFETIFDDPLENETIIVNSGFDVSTEYLLIGYLSESTPSGDGYLTTFRTMDGVLEFNLGNIEIPDFLTASNFTAKLLDITGFATAEASININLFSLIDSQKDGLISEDDFDATYGDPINDFDMENGFFPEEGIDITLQIRRDLFGDGQTNDYTGFIFKKASGYGLVEYEVEEAKIVINYTGPDTDTNDTDDTDDTDTTGNVDTGVDTEVDTEVDTDTTGTIDTDDEDDTEDEQEKKGKTKSVECGCSTVGHSKLNSLLNLLF